MTSRRRFLKGAAAAVAGLGLADVLADTEIPRGLSGCTEPPENPERDIFVQIRTTPDLNNPNGTFHLDLYPFTIYRPSVLSSLT